MYRVGASAVNQGWNSNTEWQQQITVIIIQPSNKKLQQTSGMLLSLKTVLAYKIPSNSKEHKQMFHL